MTATPLCNPPRQQILELHRRLEHLFLKTLLSPFLSVESQTAEFSDTLATQSVRSEYPSHQEGEWKAEQIALFRDDLLSAAADVAACAVVSLYHNWERSLKWLLERKMDPSRLREVRNANFDQLWEMLDWKSVSDGVRTDLDLARSITNAFKHGSGTSTNRLEKLDASLLIRPWGDEDFSLSSDGAVTMVWVRSAHVETTAKAIKQFWETLPDAYFPPIPRPSMEAFTSTDKP